jgi:hypothetical protein
MRLVIQPHCRLLHLECRRPYTIVAMRLANKKALAVARSATSLTAN